MPFPRFEKLAPQKREHLLDVAAREFAIHGFNEASINRILEQAEMSKGAAYYYFEDKGDLFCTVVQYASDTLQLSSLNADTAALSKESFWPTFADLHRVPLLRAFERPWLFTVIGVAGDVPWPRAKSCLWTKPVACSETYCNSIVESQTPTSHG